MPAYRVSRVELVPGTHLSNARVLYIIRIDITIPLERFICIGETYRNASTNSDVTIKLSNV